MVMDVPVIDLSRYLEVSGSDPASGVEMCGEVDRILRETGALVVKDPRCTADDKDRIIDMMEKYFQMPPAFKRLQERPNLHYQLMEVLF